MKKLVHLFVFLPQGDLSLGEKREHIFENLLQNLHDASIPSPISLEILGKGSYSYFFITVIEEEKQTIESIIYANFSNCEVIHYKTDPFQDSNMKGVALKPIRSDIFPIKTYEQFSGSSMANLISIIEKASDEVWVQIIIERQDASAMYHFKRKWEKNFFRLGDTLNPRSWIHPQLREIRKLAYQSAEKKLGSDVFSCSVHVAAKNPQDLPSLVRAFSPFGQTDINEFVAGRKLQAKHLQVRKPLNTFFLSIKELAGLYHFPNADFTSHLVHMQSKRAEAPRDIPKIQDGNVSFFGQTNYHGSSDEFGIAQDDRRRHLYLVGKSGSGKSKCLELLIKADLEAGRGIALLDPHGDLVDNVLRMVPEHRMKDVIIFDPSDTEFPIAFNPIEKVDPALKMQVTVGFISIFKKLFGDTWTPRLEHVLRYTVLALLDSEGTTTLSILKMLTDKNYRQKIVAKIQDSVVKNFWVSEFAGWSEKFDAEAITPLLNKVGQFVATDLIRNIVGQPVSSFNIREVMDNQKILLVKVSKGLLGEENAGLIGSMFVTKIYEAAMSRADMHEEDRKDFSLYVDEFQNFATDTFAEILSEARKYRLNLTIAHQYMGQLSETIQKTVFGNVGSMISFRVGAEDAKILAEEYNPQFTDRDIINLGVREFYAKLSVHGEIREAFSGKTLHVGYEKQDNSKAILDFSRITYGTKKQEVVDLLSKWDESGEFANSVEMTADFEAPLI